MSTRKPDQVDRILDELMTDLDFQKWVLEQALVGRITELQDPLNEQIIQRLREHPEYVEVILYGKPEGADNEPA